ncbi:unannotated protein [freshwater metagenome]|uniref:Unannotated protein n=1 Tax=freshwater metagenome TaxID=449393 RepID=A0A6J7GW18_9ZZZZ
MRAGCLHRSRPRLSARWPKQMWSCSSLTPLWAPLMQTKRSSVCCASPVARSFWWQTRSTTRVARPMLPHYGRWVLASHTWCRPFTVVAAVICLMQLSMRCRNMAKDVHAKADLAGSRCSASPMSVSRLCLTGWHAVSEWWLIRLRAPRLIPSTNSSCSASVSGGLSTPQAFAGG